MSLSSRMPEPSYQAYYGHVVTYHNLTEQSYHGNNTAIHIPPTLVFLIFFITSYSLKLKLHTTLTLMFSAMNYLKQQEFATNWYGILPMLLCFILFWDAKDFKEKYAIDKPVGFGNRGIMPYKGLVLCCYSRDKLE